MDPSLLTTDSFWEDPAPFAAVPHGMDAPDFDALGGLRHHVCFQTSGSTGVPRWVALSKDALSVSAEAVNRHLQVTAADGWGLALPVHHVGGFGVAARARAAACRFAVFGRRWDPAAFARWLADTKVTHTSLVPTQVHDLAVAAIRAPETMRAVVVGGGRLDDITGQAARALGWPVLASFGMTEAASQIATQGLEALSAPYQPAPLRVLDIWRPDVDANGRLRITGPALFSGWVEADGSRWTCRPREHPWHTTQDRVLLAEDGLTPLGRADALVKVLGELVDPGEIEDDLVRLAGGLLHAGTFAVAAVPDERSEHVLVPVFEASCPDDCADWVKSYNQDAPGFKRLRPPVIVTALPRSPLGKIRRAELVEWLRDHPAF